MISLAEELYKAAMKTDNDYRLYYYHGWEVLSSEQKMWWYRLAAEVDRRIKEAQEQVRNEFYLTLLEMKRD